MAENKHAKQQAEKKLNPKSDDDERKLSIAVPVALDHLSVLPIRASRSTFYSIRVDHDALFVCRTYPADFRVDPRRPAGSGG